MNIRKCAKWACLLLCFALVLALFGCGNAPATTAHKHTLPALSSSTAVTTTVPQTKDDDFTTFTTDQYQITLPKDFRQVKNPNGWFAYTNDHVNVLFGYEPFTAHSSLPDLPIEEYGQKMIDKHKLNAKLQKFGGVLWFEYQVDVPQQDAVYSYLVTLYKTDSAFWFIEYACDSRDMKNHWVEFLEWSLSVTFTD